MIERLAFRWVLDPVAVKRHEVALDAMPLSTKFELVEGEYLNLSWTLRLDYLNGVERHIEAAISLLSDEKLVVEASSEELERGLCLAKKLFRLVEIAERRKRNAT